MVRNVGIILIMISGLLKEFEIYLEYNGSPLRYFQKINLRSLEEWI